MSRCLGLTPIDLTEEEKIKLLPSLVLLLKMVPKIKQQGIFSVKEEIVSLDEDILMTIYNLFLSGHNPGAVKTIISNLIYTSNADNANRARVAIFAEAFAFLGDEACHISLINLLILSHLGFEFRQTYKTEIEKHFPQDYCESLFSLSSISS